MEGDDDAGGRQVGGVGHGCTTEKRAESGRGRLWDILGQACGVSLPSLLPLRLGAGPAPPNPCPPHSGCPAWSPLRESPGWGNFPGSGALHPHPRITRSPTVTEVLRGALTCVGTQTESTWTNRCSSQGRKNGRGEKGEDGLSFVSVASSFLSPVS